MIKRSPLTGDFGQSCQQIQKTIGYQLMQLIFHILEQFPMSFRHSCFIAGKWWKLSSRLEKTRWMKCICVYVQCTLYILWSQIHKSGGEVFSFHGTRRMETVPSSNESCLSLTEWWLTHEEEGHWNNFHHSQCQIWTRKVIGCDKYEIQMNGMNRKFKYWIVMIFWQWHCFDILQYAEELTTLTTVTFLIMATHHTALSTTVPKILNNTGTDTFFPVPNIYDIVLFLVPNFSDTVSETSYRYRSRDFFPYQFFAIPVPIPEQFPVPVPIRYPSYIFESQILATKIKISMMNTRHVHWISRKFLVGI